MNAPIPEPDRPHAPDLRAGGRGISRPRRAGGLEDADRQRQPVAGLHPREDAGIGGARPAQPPAHVGGADADRDRAAPVRRRHHAGFAPGAGGAGGDRGPNPRPSGRRGAGRRDGHAVGAVGLRRGHSHAEAGIAAQAIELRTLVPGAGVGRAGRHRRVGREPRRRASRRDERPGTTRSAITSAPASAD